MADNDYNLSPNFMASEFRCHHCGVLKVEMALVDRLEVLRGRIGWPIEVLSGYRCPEYNASIGGADRSYHQCGMAADIRWPGSTPDQMAVWARDTGFGGVGVYYSSGGFVHVDIGPVRDWRG